MNTKAFSTAYLDTEAPFNDNRVPSFAGGQFTVHRCSCIPQTAAATLIPVWQMEKVRPRAELNAMFLIPSPRLFPPPSQKVGKWISLFPWLLRKPTCCSWSQYLWPPGQRWRQGRQHKLIQSPCAPQLLLQRERDGERNVEEELRVFDLPFPRSTQYCLLGSSLSQNGGKNSKMSSPMPYSLSPSLIIQ